MIGFYRILTVLSSLLLAAHFLRWNSYGLMMISLCIPLLLLLKRKWPVIIGAVVMGAGAIVWIDAGIQLVRQRLAAGEPWTRGAIIMGSVALLTACAAWGMVQLSKRPRPSIKQP